MRLVLSGRVVTIGSRLGCTGILEAIILIEGNSRRCCCVLKSARQSMLNRGKGLSDLFCPSFYAGIALSTIL